MIDRVFIKKYLQGDLSETETGQFTNYLQQKDLTELKQLMAEEWENLSAKQEQPNVSPDISANMWTDIAQATINNQSAKIRPLYIKRILSIAASIIILLGVGLYFWDSLYSYEEIATNTREQRQIELPDGSKVLLNNNSTLRYATTWNSDEIRQVWLEGEAYFEVAGRHEEGIKFEVITRDITVEVLGTTFNVNSKNTERTLVYLKEGSVKLKAKNEVEQVEMIPGELATYSQVSHEISKVTIPPTHHTSWREGVLEFVGAPIEEVFDRIEEIYGITIIAKDTSLLDHPMTIGVPTNNLEITIDFIEKAMNLNIIQSGDSLLVR